MAKKQGGDRGKSRNVTGTQPKPRPTRPENTPGRQGVKMGPRRAVTGKHAARKAQGAKTSATRKAGPRKTPPGTTTRSADK
jgi:hypothetical protein